MLRHARTHTHTHTRLTALCPGLPIWVSQYQKGKTNLDFTEARDSEWQWHQLGRMLVCTSLKEITMPAPHHSPMLRHLFLISVSSLHGNLSQLNATHPPDHSQLCSLKCHASKIKIKLNNCERSDKQTKTGKTALLITTVIYLYSTSL